MIESNKIPDDIFSFMPAVEKYLNNHSEVVFAYLFGSLARGARKPTSDVDIAVYLDSSANYGELKFELLTDLSHLLNTDQIDLVILNNASLSLVMNILKSKKCLADKKPFERHAFESLTMRKYFDFSIRESAQLKRRYLNG